MSTIAPRIENPIQRCLNASNTIAKTFKIAHEQNIS